MGDRGEGSRGCAHVMSTALALMNLSCTLVGLGTDGVSGGKKEGIDAVTCNLRLFCH